LKGPWWHHPALRCGAPAEVQGSGAELIMGSGRFAAPKTLEVILNDGGTRVLAVDKVFLDVGTHAAIPNVPGLEAANTKPQEG
jgi:pyruvate/2-oxoglutarate dehydrogenase complex dihydrolipoamide dehydrogenase (E3) component